VPVAHVLVDVLLLPELLPADAALPDAVLLLHLLLLLAKQHVVFAVQAALGRVEREADLVHQGEEVLHKGGVVRCGALRVDKEKGPTEWSESVYFGDSDALPKSSLKPKGTKYCKGPCPPGGTGTAQRGGVVRCMSSEV
jgi:hypothetical protein